MDITRKEIEEITNRLVAWVEKGRKGELSDYEKGWGDGHSDAGKQHSYRQARLIRLADKTREDMADCPPEDFGALRGFYLGIRRAIEEMVSYESDLDPDFSEEVVAAAANRVNRALPK